MHAGLCREQQRIRRDPVDRVGRPECGRVERIQVSDRPGRILHPDRGAAAAIPLREIRIAEHGVGILERDRTVFAEDHLERGGLALVLQEVRAFPLHHGATRRRVAEHLPMDAAGRGFEIVPERQDQRAAHRGGERIGDWRVECVAGAVEGAERDGTVVADAEQVGRAAVQRQREWQGDARGAIVSEGQRRARRTDVDEVRRARDGGIAGREVLGRPVGHVVPAALGRDRDPVELEALARCERVRQQREHFAVDAVEQRVVAKDRGGAVGQRIAEIDRVAGMHGEARRRAAGVGVAIVGGEPDQQLQSVAGDRRFGVERHEAGEDRTGERQAGDGTKAGCVHDAGLVDGGSRRAVRAGRHRPYAGPAPAHQTCVKAR